MYCKLNNIQKRFYLMQSHDVYDIYLIYLRHVRVLLHRAKLLWCSQPGMYILLSNLLLVLSEI